MSKTESLKETQELDQYLDRINRAYLEKDFLSEIKVTDDLINWVHNHKDLVDDKVFNKLRKQYNRQTENLIGIIEYEQAAKVMAQLIDLEKSVFPKMNIDQTIDLAHDYLELAHIFQESDELNQALFINLAGIKLLENLDFKSNSKVAVKLLDLYLLILQLYAAKEDIKKLMLYHKKINKIYNFYRNNNKIPKVDRLEVMIHFSKAQIASGDSIKDLTLLEEISNELKDEDVLEFSSIWRIIGSDYMTILQMVTDKIEKLNKVDELFDRSIEIYQKLIEVERIEKNITGLANIYLLRGIVEQDKDHNKALKYFNEALKLFEESLKKDPLTKFESALGLVHKNLSQIYFSQEEYDEALTHIQKTLQLENKQFSYFNNPSIQSTIIDNEIFENMIYKFLENKSEVVDHSDIIIDKFEKLIKLTDNLEDKDYFIDFLLTEADYQASEDNIDKAINYYKRAIKVLEGLVTHDNFRRGTLNYTYSSLQKLYKDLGEIEKAEEITDKIGNLTDAINNDEFLLMREYLRKYREGLKLQDEGKIALGLEAFLEAEKYIYKRSIIADDPHIPFYIAAVDANIGKSYFELNQEDKGAPYLKRAIPLLIDSLLQDNEMAFEMLYYSVLTLANYYQENNRVEDSIEMLEKMLEIVKNRVEEDLTEINLFYICSIYQLLPKAYVETEEIDKLNDLIDEILSLVLKLKPTIANADITGKLLDSAYIACIIDSSKIKDYLNKLQILRQIFELLYKKGYLDFRTKLSLFNIYYELSMELADPEEKKVLYEKVLKIGQELQEEDYSHEIGEILDSIRDLYLKS